MIELEAKADLFKVLDGDFIQDFPSTQLALGKFVKVPLLIGCNADEGTSFGVDGINTDEEFATAIAQGGPDTETITILEALYPNIQALGIPSEATYSGPETAAIAGTQFKRSAAFCKLRLPRHHSVRGRCNACCLLHEREKAIYKP